ncbi:MAG: apolipoprotein N-acyltransferase [bacterium]|nr:apolipoprotein N-acyltransferase [bacterium]MDT8367165.1 apolipoprotein N-acyltransferase [bacterium]
MKHMLVVAVLSMVSAALLILSSPGYGYSFLAWVALVPLLIVIKSSRLSESFIYSLLAGQLFYFGHLSWMYSIDGISPVIFALLGLVNAWLFGLFGFAASLLKRERAFDVILFPALWALIEYLHHHQGFLSLTWGTLAYTQYEVPAVNWIASLTGIYGISFLIVFVNACIAHAIISLNFQTIAKENQGGAQFAFPGVRALLLPAVVMVLILAIGMVRTFPDDISAGDCIKAGLVQAGLPGYSSSTDDEKREALRRLKQLSLAAAAEHPAFIVWPETAVPGKIPYDSIMVKMLSRISDESGASLLVGAAGYDKFQSSERQQTGIANSAFLFKPGERIVGRYEKIMLVPFNEYLPLRGKITWPRWIVGSNWKNAQPGSEMTILEADGLRFGVQICWENLFPDHFRKVSAQGVDFMVSITNESFVKAPAAREQMLAFNIFRAIENHVSILRAASTGISAMISPKGEITAMIKDEHGKPEYGAGMLVDKVQATSQRSFYNRHGDWFVVALALLMCVYFCFLLGETLFRLKNR